MIKEMMRNRQNHEQKSTGLDEISGSQAAKTEAKFEPEKNDNKNELTKWPTWAPSKETMKTVAKTGMKGIVVQIGIVGIIGVIGFVIGKVLNVVIGWESGEYILKNLMFCAVQFLQVSGIVLSLFTASVSKSQRGAIPIDNNKDKDKNETKNQAPPHEPDKWEFWVQLTLIFCLIVPFFYLYVPSNKTLYEMVICVFWQWIFKMLCFIGFPREIITVPTN